MKMDEHARAWSHEFVNGILGQSALPPEQRSSLHWEILSHLHEAAERRVEARGGQSITLADLQATVQELGGPTKIGAAFLENRVVAMPRAGFWRRAGAYLVDAALAGAAAGIYFTVLDFMFPFGRFILDDLSGLAFLALCYSYLVLMEVRYGQTVGKMVFKLRTVRTDGRPVNYREAMIRNVAKVFPPLLAVDTLLYLVAFYKDDQRASDRLAETIVVDGSRPVWSTPPATVPAPRARSPSEKSSFADRLREQAP